MLIKKPFTRRKLLAGLGGAGAVAALSPFVPLLHEPTRALDGYPKRLIIFATNTGMTGRYPGNWEPSGGVRDFTIAPTSILGPLASHRNQLVLLQGVDMQSFPDSPQVGGHPTGMANMLTAIPQQTGNDFGGGGQERSGWADGVSIDQRVAAFYEGETPFRSLEAGVRVTGSGDIRNRISYRGPAEPVPPENDPQVVLDRFFDGVGVAPVERDRIRAERASILDVVREDLRSLEPRLGTADRQKLDAHLTALRSVETRLLDMSVTTCSLPEIEAIGGSVTLEANTPAVTSAHLDLITAALACNLTRVASILFGSAPISWTFPWLDRPLSTGLHALSHAASGNDAAQADLLRAAQWFAGHFGGLLDRLASVPEGDGTMLDNSLVVWCTENARSNNHDWRNMPYVLAGSAGGAIEPGRFLRYAGEPHNKLWVSVCHAMGLEDVESFGGSDYARGPLTSLVS
jgi:hypothetical protein